MSTTAIRALSEAEQEFKTIVFDPAIKALQLSLVAAVPALATPGLSFIEREIMKYAADWVFGQVSLWIDLGAIKFVNAEHQATWSNAVEKLAIIKHDKGIDSDEYKNARAAAAAAFSQFTRVNQ